MTESLSIVVGTRGAQHNSYLTGIDADGNTTMRMIERGAEPPAMHLPTEVATVLLDALAQHFGGTADTRQLRTDYDDERHRVDQLIATLATVATLQPTVEVREAR
jgi:hypothetical protein